MKYRQWDEEEVLAYARAGLSANRIIETLGLNVGERTIQKFVAARLGHRPTTRSVERYNPIRSRVAAYMVSQGLDERYCTLCHRRSSYKGAIRELRESDSLDDLIFVCRRCWAPGDQ